MRPAVCETAEQIYAEVPPFAAPDEDTGWHLLLFIDANALALFEPIHDLVADRDDAVGWELALDPDETPAYALPWLAQFTGAVLIPAMNEAEQRAKVKDPDGPGRGRPAALLAAAKATLTGSQSIYLDERWEGSAYKLRVRTLAGETPDEAATLAAVLSQKPGGIVLTYDAVVTGDWADVAASFTDFADLSASNADWAAVALTPPV